MELVMLTANLLVVFALELGTTTLILAVILLRLFVGEIEMTLTCRRAWLLQLRSRLWELHQRCNLRVQPSTILVHCCTLSLCHLGSEIGYRVVTPYTGL